MSHDLLTIRLFLYLQKIIIIPIIRYGFDYTDDKSSACVCLPMVSNLVVHLGASVACWLQKMLSIGVADGVAALFSTNYKFKFSTAQRVTASAEASSKYTRKPHRSQSGRSILARQLFVCKCVCSILSLCPLVFIFHFAFYCRHLLQPQPFYFFAEGSYREVLRCG